jgi:hypothetical protein
MNEIDIKFIRACDLLGIIDSQAIVRFAEQALTDPIDQNLLELSLCDPNDEDCVSRAKLALYQVAGLDEMDKKSSLKYYARVICGQIVDGLIGPLEGTQKIARAAICAGIEKFDELDPFIYIYSEVSDRPAERDFFERAARREAASLVGQKN